MIKMRLLSALLICPLLFLSQVALAQTKPVSGKITDEKGEAIPGASVQAKGTSIGTVSDPSGAFKLNVPSQTKTLVVSFIGYAPRRLASPMRPKWPLSSNWKAPPSQTWLW